jgi:murein DD-endopeptidase MepM/ murein hydrolase activator NlpD
VDYFAPTGTPIMAAGDGKVTMAASYSGYGNCVTLDHAGNYSTLYGHLSRFASGIHKGSSVKQGQVIGYVGSTGLATGPHLHYEFHIGNKVVNPVTVALPKAEGIPKHEMARFSSQIQPLFVQLKDAAGKPKVVSVQPGTPANQNAL